MARTYKNYKPKNKVTCKKCKETIYSVLSGRFKRCSCGATYIDETEYYTRIGGNKEDVIIEKLTNDDFRNFIWTTSKNEKIKIMDLEVSHIENIIKDFEINKSTNNYYYEIMLSELKLRNSELTK